MNNIIVWFTILSVYGVACLAVNDIFLYFAYGSNLLKKRIRLHNPTAVYIGAAELENYRLDFNMFVNYWNGTVATIVPHSGRKVWGALWDIDHADMERLDKQEGVPEGWYFPLNVTVKTMEGTELVVRSYQQTKDPTYEEILPMERRPSNTYLQVITLGAMESKLPSDYIGSLFTFLSNGQFANAAIREYLGYPF